MEAKPFHQLIEDRYGDRGGWKGLIHLINTRLPYEVKIQNIKEQYRVSTGQAKNWYGKYKKFYVNEVQTRQ